MEKKRLVKKALRNWKKGEEGREYRRIKKEYKELCNRKKERERERWERETEEARMEGQVWKVVNRDRKRWRGINREKSVEWGEYFKSLLRGIEGRGSTGKGGGKTKRRKGVRERRD